MNFTTSQYKTLQKKGIETDIDLLYFFPRNYITYIPLEKIQFLSSKTNVSAMGVIKKIKRFSNFFQAQVQRVNGEILYVTWFHQDYLYSIIQHWVKKTVYIAGEAEVNKFCNIQMTNPAVFSLNPADIIPYCPVYPNLKGISTDNLRRNIYDTLNIVTDVLPQDIMTKYSLVDRRIAFFYMHFPANGEAVYQARQYFAIEAMYLFASELTKVHLDQQNGFQVKTWKETQKVIQNLPYELTNSQKEISEKLIEDMTKENRVSALVQGDVGCGKTTIAQYTALAMAENGYQVALIAPTTVLAEQHYQNFVKLVGDNPLFKPLLFNGGLTVKQKKEVMRKIQEQEVNIIIGTTAVLNTQFASLGLIIVDEEHRFGVAQKELLSKESESGVNSITMSATPIPRSLATVLYAGTSSVYQVTDLPKGRKPVVTKIVQNSSLLLADIEAARERGEKIYIICSKVDEENANDKLSVEKAEKKYKTLLKNPEKICSVTGKMKTEEIQKKVQEFKNGQYNVLIATTVVEVGVDVSDATMILIEDADMFGLSQLHQLRGRVGRSSLQSFCYLIPRSTAKEKAIERLQILCSSNDGFVISEADLKERGPGDILGERQSGKDSDLLLALKYPNTFQYLMEYAKRAR